MLVAAPGDGGANRGRKSLACATILRAGRPGRTGSSMDKLDARILDLLQANGELTAAEIAERVGLSKVPCWRRIQRGQQGGGGRQTAGPPGGHPPHVGAPG